MLFDGNRMVEDERGNRKTGTVVHKGCHCGSRDGIDGPRGK